MSRSHLDGLTAEQRKGVPIATGFIDYFPKAIAEVAACSKIANDQHHPDKPLHWDRDKSTDEHDALMRHFLDRGTIDDDGIRHSTKVAWRALAALEKELEAAEPLRQAPSIREDVACTDEVSAPEPEVEAYQRSDFESYTKVGRLDEGVIFRKMNTYYCKGSGCNGQVVQSNTTDIGRWREFEYDNAAYIQKSHG